MRQHPDTTTSRRSAVLILLAGAALISFSPVFVKLAARADVGTTAIAFWRTLGGGLTLLALASARRASWRLSARSLLFAALAAALFYVDLFSWHRSIVYAGAGLSTVLANTQVFAGAVISFFVFRERLAPPFMIAATVAFLGVALLVGIGSADVTLSATYVRGVAYGLFAGLAYAGFVVCLKKGQTIARRSDPVVFVGWTSLFSAPLLGLTGWLEGNSFVPDSTTGYLSLAGLAVLVQALGWMVISRALPRVVTARAGLILLLQPILAMVWGVILFAEYLTMVQTLGAVITLVAMYVGITQRQQPPTQHATH